MVEFDWLFSSKASCDVYDALPILCMTIRVHSHAHTQYLHILMREAKYLFGIVRIKKVSIAMIV